jgi:NAD+ synthase (glutamine-hydrolysing)
MELEYPDFKVAMVQMDIANSPQENAERFLEKTRAAVRDGANIVVGSEMMLLRYIRGDSYEDEGVIRDSWRAAMKIVAASKHIDAVLIFGGIGLDEDGDKVGEDGRLRKYNVAFVVQNGQLIHNRAGVRFAVKTLLPDYRVFDDNRHFFSLRELAEEVNVRTEAMLMPFPVTIRGREYQLGVMLCEDMWDMDYSVKPAEALAKNGADIFINLSCSPWTWQKNRKRDEIIKSICQKTGLPFIYVNNVGCQNNGKNFIVFDGASTAYDQQGNIIALTEPYHESVCLVDYCRENPTVIRPKEEDVPAMFKAIVVATRGYLKTLAPGITKVVVGASGGIDSSLSIALYAHILGPENVVAVNMPYSDYNSEETKSDAKLLCENLGVTDYRIRPITVGVDDAAEADDIEVGTGSHKTLQATTRLQRLVGIAAKEKAWISCNANWTEAFFGYGTLNGDLRGDFNPWANVLKRDIFRLAMYMNEVVYGREVIPMSVITRPPMDELVAQGTGERADPFEYGSLTANGYHDQMVRAVVAFRYGPEAFIECYLDGTLEKDLLLPEGALRRRFSTAEIWLEDLERCFNLYYANIRKHVQSVPGPLLDKRAFGWDFRESIGVGYDTVRLSELKDELLEKYPMTGYWPKERRERFITRSTAGITIDKTNGRGPSLLEGRAARKRGTLS